MPPEIVLQPCCERSDRCRRVPVLTGSRAGLVSIVHALSQPEGQDKGELELLFWAREFEVMATDREGSGILAKKAVEAAD